MQRRRSTHLPDTVVIPIDKAIPKIYCPYCQSSRIEVTATASHVTLCCCTDCHAQFTLYHPRLPEQRS